MSDDALRQMLDELESGEVEDDIAQFRATKSPRSGESKKSPVRRGDIDPARMSKTQLYQFGIDTLPEEIMTTIFPNGIKTEDNRRHLLSMIQLCQKPLDDPGSVFFPQ